MLITLTHELFHHRQKCKFLDFRTEETTAAYIETGAAKYYVEHGEISPDTDNETLCFTHRTHYERFAMPFNHMVVIGNADEAYTYADFMDFLERKTLQKKPLMGGALITEYSYSATHAENYMKWFGIKDEKTFARYLEEFCILHVSDIYLVLKGLEKESDRLKPVIVSREKPIVQVPLGSPAIGLSYYVAPFELMDNSKAPFNAFVSWKDVHYDHDYLSFYIGTSPGYSTVEKGEFFSGEKWWHQGACFSGKPANTVLYQSFTVVALYAPDAPVIKKVKKNYVRFVLPKADKDLVKAGYITGALVTYRNADGAEKYIRAGVNKLGKEVKWSIPGVGNSGFTLRVKWICENEDGSVYESPASKPAGQGSVPKEKEPVTASANVGKEKKQQEGPKKNEEPAAQQDREEKLVEYQEVKEMPWKGVNVSLSLPCENILFFEDCYVSQRLIVGTEQELYPDSYKSMTYNIKSEARFEKAGEGYRLILKQTESGTRRTGVLEDGEYNLTVQFFFDEDLHPVKGSFDGTSSQKKILPKGYYFDQNNRIVNFPAQSVPSTMSYSGTFSFKDSSNKGALETLSSISSHEGALETLSMKGHWQKRRPGHGSELEDVNFSKTMADVKALKENENWGGGYVRIILDNR